MLADYCILGIAEYTCFPFYYFSTLTDKNCNLIQLAITATGCYIDFSSDVFEDHRLLDNYGCGSKELKNNFNRGVAQFGQSAAFGTQRSQVQILSPRLV